MSSQSKCKHKWRYVGIYDSGYYNHKECIYCNKLGIERSKKQMLNEKTTKISTRGTYRASTHH